MVEGELGLLATIQTTEQATADLRGPRSRVRRTMGLHEDDETTGVTTPGAAPGATWATTPGAGGPVSTIAYLVVGGAVLATAFALYVEFGPDDDTPDPDPGGDDDDDDDDQDGTDTDDDDDGDTDDDKGGSDIDPDAPFDSAEPMPFAPSVEALLLRREELLAQSFGGGK